MANVVTPKNFDYVMIQLKKSHSHSRSCFDVFHPGKKFKTQEIHVYLLMKPVN